jgi:hypothetical protein
MRADVLRTLVPLATLKIGLMPPAELTDAQTAVVLDALGKPSV